MIKVSIAVAIYNSEAYLQRCVDSLLSQTLKEIEIILVSDASPDNSINIMKNYRDKWPEKIRIIELSENLRAGGARNAGIKIAQGEYFGYVDHDDFIDSQMYEKLYNSAKMEDADLAESWFYSYNDTTNTSSKREYFGGPAKIVRRRLLVDNDIYFPEKIVYEDNYFWLLVKEYAHKRVSVPECLYYHAEQINSVSHTISEMFIKDRLQICEKLLETVKTRGLETKPYTIEFQEEFIKIFCVNTFYSFASRRKLNMRLINECAKRIHSIMSTEFYDCLNRNSEYAKRIKPIDAALIWCAIHSKEIFAILTFLCSTVGYGLKKLKSTAQKNKRSSS